MPTTDKLVGYNGLAVLLGITVPSVRTYHQRAKANRRKAEQLGDPTIVTPRDLPEPDNQFGNSPVWKESTVHEWVKNRNEYAADGPKPRTTKPQG